MSLVLCNHYVTPQSSKMSPAIADKLGLVNSQKERRMMAARAEGWGKWKQVVKEYKLSVRSKFQRSNIEHGN